MVLVDLLVDGVSIVGPVAVGPVVPFGRLSQAPSRPGEAGRGSHRGRVPDGGVDDLRGRSLYGWGFVVILFAGDEGLVAGVGLVADGGGGLVGHAWKMARRATLSEKSGLSRMSSSRWEKKIYLGSMVASDFSLRWQREHISKVPFFGPSLSSSASLS